MNLHSGHFFNLAIVAGSFAAVVARADTNLNEQPYRLGTVVVKADAEAAPAGSSVTVISGQALTERGVTSLRELTATTPNLTTFDANGDRTPRFSLRGLRENNFSYGESAVGIYVDDVPYSDLYTRGVPLFDLYGGEFYRGPQPTSFGANRPGGVLNLMTRLPGNEYHARGSVSYGNYNAVNIQAGADGALVKDKLFLGISGLYGWRDGYFNNLITGNDPDEHETFAGRAQLRWTPTETLDFTASVAADLMNDGGIITRPLAAPGDLYEVKYDQDGYNRQSSQTYALRGAWTGESLQAVSVTSWRTWRQNTSGDFDFAEFFSPGNFPVPAAEGFAQPKVQQWSQEFRLQSLDQTAELKWNAGAFWSQLTRDHHVGVNFGPAAGFVFPAPVAAGDFDLTTGRNRATDVALFGQATYTVAEKLDLTAGVRLEYFDVRGSRTHSMTVGGFPIVTAGNYSGDFRSIQPRVNIAYHFTPDVTAWFNFTTGYQPGGFSPSTDNAAAARYEAAKSLHYEIGVSAKMFDGKLIATATGFWIDTKDYQVYRPVPNFAGLDFYIVNADRARTIGGELELCALPCEFLEFRFAGGYQNAEFRRFTTPAPFSQNLDGKDINFVPQFTIDASVTAHSKCGTYATVGATVLGDYWFDEPNTAKQEAYATLYARIGWQGKNFGVSIFGRNLTDTHYYANALDLGPRAGFPNGFMVGTPGDPRVYGIELTAKF